MIRARLRVLTSDRKEAESIVKALAPDNMNLRGFHVRAGTTINSARFSMSFEGKIETFISTLDDMLACIQAATRTLNRITTRTE